MQILVHNSNSWNSNSKFAWVLESFWNELSAIIEVWGTLPWVAITTVPGARSAEEDARSERWHGEERKSQWCGDLKEGEGGSSLIPVLKGKRPLVLAEPLGSWRLVPSQSQDPRGVSLLCSFTNDIRALSALGLSNQFDLKARHHNGVIQF